MEHLPANPYFNLAMIRNIDMFFGRYHLLRRFYAAIANHQSVSILGKRRMGKSSFLWCASLPEMHARFSYDLSRHIFVFLDLHDFLHRSREDFFHKVSQEIINQSAKVLGLNLATKMSGADRFGDVLEQVVQSGFFPVLLLDSFDKVTLNEDFGPEFFGFLRAQASRGRVSYVTASIKPLYEVSHHGIEGSPFFNIFYNYALEALTAEEAIELITVPSTRAGMLFTEKEVALVRKLAGRHPFFIQRACHFLFDEKIQHGDKEIDEAHLQSEVYRDLLPHFKDSWDQLTHEEQINLRNEIAGQGPQRKLPELSESALFRDFMLDNSQPGNFSITVEDLDGILDKFSDSKVLGNGNLAQMRIVLRRLEKNASPSAMEKATVIREVLREALERLAPDGVRKDSAPEWQYYNILYYRYFRYQLKNEQISTRLEFTSLRQYFRARNKALEAFHNVLLEMERAVLSNHA